MKVKLSEIIDSGKVFESLFVQRLNGGLAFKVSSIIRVLKDHIETFDKTRLSLLQEYGKLSEDESKYEFETPEKEAEFTKEFQGLLDTEVELQVQKLNFLDLDKIPQIMPAEVDVIRWAIIGEKDGNI